MRKRVWLLSIIAMLGLVNCGGGSEEAKKLLQKILQFVGIPQSIVVNVCQDANRDGVCSSDEHQTKVTINKGDSVEDIWQKISLTDDGRYLLETYNPELPLLVELQDTAKVNGNDGKFTLAFDGFKTQADDNETKEISILESMVDANALSKVEADKFRTLTNQEAQDKYYASLLNALETNINTLRAKGLDDQTATTASIQEMGDETKANQEQADRINACGSNQACVDEEIKKISDELILDNNNSEATDSNATIDPSESTAKTFTSTLKKTGQTTSYEQFDDGHYQMGVTPSYSRSGEIVTDSVTGLQWQDNEEAGEEGSRQNWEDAKSHCLALSLGGQSDWRLPTIDELKGLVDYGKTNPAIRSAFQHVSSDGYWSSTTAGSDSSAAWDVYFYYGGDGWGDKAYDLRVRCVRGGE